MIQYVGWLAIREVPIGCLDPHSQRFYVAVLSVMAVFLCGCHEPTQSKPPLTDPYSNAPLHSSFDIEVLFTDSSFTRARLRAGSAVVDEAHMQTTLGKGVHVAFYDRSTHTISAWLKADSAIIDDRTKDMTAIGHVWVQSDSSNTTLETPQLIWVQTDERIKTSSVVRITTPTEVIDGVGLISDQYLTDYKIFNVKGVHQP